MESSDKDHRNCTWKKERKGNKKRRVTILTQKHGRGSLGAPVPVGELFQVRGSVGGHS